MTKRKENDPGDREDEAVAQLLDRLTLEEPPPGIKEYVLRAIEARPEPAREGWLESLRAGLRRRFLVRMAPLAAGVGVAVIAVALIYGRVGTRGVGTGSMEGAMVPSSSRGSTQVVDDQRFELNGANVRLQVARTSGRVAASIATRTAHEVSIVLQYDPSRLRVERLEQAGPPPGGAEHGPNWIRIRQAADGGVRVVFQESGAGDAPIQVGITSGTMFVQGALRTRSVQP